MTNESTMESSHDDGENDPWGGWNGYVCEWCDGYQFVPPEDETHPTLLPGRPLTAGRRWVCLPCYTEDLAPWPDEWTHWNAAIRRVQ